MARNGEILGHEAFGEADPLVGDPMTTDAQFRICSQTKAITSMAAMVLWERGQLGLDDPVSAYLPEFADIGVLDTLLADSTGVYSPPSRPVTIRHLMTHTSGIPYGDIGDPRFAKLYTKQGVVDLFPIDGRSTRDNASRMARTGWPIPRGTMDLRIGTGRARRRHRSRLRKALCRVPADRIARPAGHGPHPLRPARGPARPLLEVFEPDSAGTWKPHQHPAYTTEYPTREDWPLCSGGAGLTSTAMDYARFLQMVLDRGAIPGGRLLEEATIDTILADHAPGLVDEDWHQGLAFGVRKKPDGQGRFFWGGYFNTQGYGDPTTGELALLMKQTYGARNDSTSSAFSALLGR